MSRGEVNIKPGGQISDIVENELGKSQHQQVINLEQHKKGEWRSPPGFKNICDEFTSIKAAIEVTEDRTDERFLLVQEGTGLKRVDYDISNSPAFGYENESSYTVDLPSGVEILSTATLRFFYFRGIVRITGAVSTADNEVIVPLWYGYIDRELFQDSYSELEKDDFNSDVGGWIGVDCTVSRETSAPMLEGAGSLKGLQTDTDGYIYKSFSVTVGKKYRIYLRDYKTSGQGNDNHTIQLGTTQGGNEYVIKLYSDTDEWIVFDEKITATETLLYITLNIGLAQNSDYCHYDYLLIEEVNSIVIKKWVMEKTHIDGEKIDLYTDNVWDSGVIFDPIARTILGKTFLTYDEAQHSLLNGIIHDDTDHTTTDLDYEMLTAVRILERFKVTIPGSNLQDNWLNDRITFMRLFTYIGEKVNLSISKNKATYDEDLLNFYLQENFDLTDGLGEMIYYKQNFHYDITGLHPKRLYLAKDATGKKEMLEDDGYFAVGQRLTLTDGIENTIITAVSYDLGDDFDSYIELLDDIDPNLDFDPVSGLLAVMVTLKRRWVYSDSLGYYTYIIINTDSANTGYEYHAFTEIPSGTESINPQYSFHEVTEKRAYVVSREDDEKDMLRYSPINQFDNFPSEMIMATEVGDTDEIKALLKRDKRLCIMKGNSLSQGGYYNGSYSEDIGLAKRGIYSPNGFCVISNTLYYLGKDDVYMFAGLDPKPLLVIEKLKNLYREHVSETSLLAYDLLNNRLWLILQNYILVFNPARNEWYERDIDMNPVCWFLDADQKLIICSSDKIVTFNHSETTFDESIRCYIKSSLLDDETSEYLKKVNKGKIKIQSSHPMKIKFYDPEEDTTGVEEEFIPETAKIDNNRISPKYHFKQLEFEMQPQAYHDDLAVIIRNIQLEIEKAG